jgi:hypothetical protein
MPMPKKCIDCPACNEYLMCAVPVNGRGWGESDVRDFSQGRPEWCPMKEQEAVVRCKDCIYGDDFDCPAPLPTGYVCQKGHGSHTGDWFCADGGKR